MTNPSNEVKELADALFERDEYQEPHDNVILSRDELRDLARAAEKVGERNGARKALEAAAKHVSKSRLVGISITSPNGVGEPVSGRAWSNSAGEAYEDVIRRFAANYTPEENPDE
jgi:hypothetical protein